MSNSILKEEKKIASGPFSHSGSLIVSCLLANPRVNGTMGISSFFYQQQS